MLLLLTHLIMRLLLLLRLEPGMPSNMLLFRLLPKPSLLSPPLVSRSLKLTNSSFILKDDMSANVEMMETQISQVTSLLQTLDTALHPQLQPFQALLRKRIHDSWSLLISCQLFVIKDQYVYSKDDAPADEKMVESQLSDLISLLQSVYTDLRPQLQPSLLTITTQISDLQPLMCYSKLSAINKHWSPLRYTLKCLIHV